MNTQTFKITDDIAGQRLDKTLASLCPDHSRARLQSLIKDGQLQINGITETKRSTVIEPGDKLTLTVPEAIEATPQPENIPLDIVYEDEHLVVINKQAGLVVHPGAGNWTGTLVNALLHHCKDSLSGIGGVMRPGIVHRLDKDTTGLMVAAKTDKAHKGLADQLADRTLTRLYHALVLKTPVPLKSTIDAPLGRHPKNRLKMAVRPKSGKPSRTHYHVIEDFHGALSLVECKLESGRTHQIRVHMDHIGHQLIGDPLYGPQPTALTAALKKVQYGTKISEDIMNFPRPALHAKAISFVHPITGQTETFETAHPEDLDKALISLR